MGKMDKYFQLMSRTLNIAKKVLNAEQWYFSNLSLPKRLMDGEEGWEIIKIQFGKEGQYPDEANGIEAIAAKDVDGFDYFLIGAICDDPIPLKFDASDIEIAATIGRCSQVIEDFNEWSHAFPTV